MAKQRRMLVPISEEVLERLRPLAASAGLTLPELVDTLLSRFLSLAGSRPDLLAALLEALAYVQLSRFGAAMIPFDALLEALDELDEDGYRTVVEEYTGLARVYAASLREIIGEPQIHHLRYAISALLPGTVVNVVYGNGVARVVIASPNLSTKRRRSFVASVVKAVADAYSLKVKSVREAEGVVSAELEGGGS